MYRISWDVYKSTVREKTNGITVTNPSQKKNPFLIAREEAVKALQDIARKYRVDYNLLIGSFKND